MKTVTINVEGMKQAQDNKDKIVEITSKIVS